MIGSTRILKVWAWASPCDLRKGFDGLYGLVVSKLGKDPLSGDCFLFVNRARTRAKVLVWDGSGLVVYQKRLEQNRFAFLWRDGDGRVVELTQSELSLFLEGCQLVERARLSPAQYVPRAIGGSGV